MYLLAELIREETLLWGVECGSWEELVGIDAKPLIELGLIEPRYLDSIKEAVEKHGAYMVLVDDVAFFHGRPEDGVNEYAMSLAVLKTPVYLLEKSIKAAFVFAAVDNSSHIDLLRELAELLDNEEFYELLRNGGSRGDIAAYFQ